MPQHYPQRLAVEQCLKIQVFSLINCKGVIILCFWYKKKEKASWSSRYNPGEVLTFSLFVLQLIFTSRFTAFFSITGFREERIKEMKAEHNTLRMYFILFSLIHSHISQSTCARWYKNTAVPTHFANLPFQIAVRVTVKSAFSTEVQAGVKPKMLSGENGHEQCLSSSVLRDRSRAPWVEPRWNTRRWKGKWWFVIKTFQRKADAKGPIYACYNFTRTLPHAP